MATYMDFQDLLESDDELPCTYDETPDVPAYQNDNRFDSVDFPWLNKKNEEPATFTDAATSDLETNNEKAEKHPNTLVIAGVLSKEDLLCLKYISKVSTHSYLLWFIDFLIHKDMQSKYNFLQSCLVRDFSYLDDLHTDNELGLKEIKYKYKIIVK